MKVTTDTATTRVGIAVNLLGVFGDLRPLLLQARVNQIWQ